MNTNQILEEVKLVMGNLNESGIKIPNGTKSVKIIHHQDLDGVFSAIVAYNQLLKQGIKSKDIKLDGIQYNNNDKLGRLLNASGKTATVLVDFARLEDTYKNEKGEVVKTRRPDFWSDHHEKPEGYVKGNVKGKNISKAGGRIGATEFKSDTDHLATLHTNNLIDSATLKAVNAVDSASYKSIEDTFTLRKDFKKKNRMERMAILINAMMSDTGLWNNSSLLQGFIKKVNPSLTSVYNQMFNYVSLSNVQKQGIKELASANPDWNLVEKIRKEMPDKRSREAVVGKGMMKQRTKENSLTKEERAKALTKRKEDEEAKRLKREAKYKSLKEGAFEDREEVKLLKKSKQTPEVINRIKELSDPIKKIVSKRESSLKKHTNEYKKDATGKFERKKNVTFAPSGTQRYLWALLQKNGIKSPFVIKKFGSMIQVAVNPSIPDEVKSKIDLNVIRKKIMDEVKKEVNDKFQDWSFDIIEKSSGGHKGITNIASLNLINLAPKKIRDELKYISSFEKRIKALKNYGSRKLSEEDKVKLKNAKKIINAVEKKDPLTDEDRDLFNRLKIELNKLVNNEKINGKVLDEYDKWKKDNSKYIMPKGDIFKNKKDLSLKKHIKIMTKIKPDEEKRYKEAKLLDAKLMPTLEKLFPNKASRKAELLDQKNVYDVKAKEIKQSIIDKFEENINKLVEKYKIELKGTNDNFEVKGKVDKSKMSDDELDKLADEGRRNYKKMSFKQKQEIIKKKRKENVNLTKEEKEEQEEQQNFIRKGYKNSEALKLAKEKIERNNKGIAAAIKARSK